MSFFRGFFVTCCWAACALVAAPASLFAQFTPSSPEEHAFCTQDEACTPILQGRQHAACIQARCVRNSCEITFLKGKKIESSLQHDTGCYTTGLVCDEQGVPQPDTDVSSRIPSREGEDCAPEVPFSNPCEKGICRSGVCAAAPKEDGVLCSDPGVKVSSCEVSMCVSGLCTARPNLDKVNERCAESVTSTCTETSYACSPNGSCRPTETLKSGAECSPSGGLIAPPNEYTTLLLQKADPPPASCNPTTCKLQFCGDGQIATELGEECDSSSLPHSAATGARCNSNCKLNFCGDGIIDYEAGEFCDGSSLPAGSESGSVCNSQCKVEAKPFCGDGRIDSERGEQCDGTALPAGAAPFSRCLGNCTLAYCGDGVINPGEECDAGGAALVKGAKTFCNAFCQREYCGDGRVNRDLGEECDGIYVSSSRPGARCTAQCQIEYCGDGKINPSAGEQCDGDSLPSDAPRNSSCNALCKLEFCGDGVISGGLGEECDGKNLPPNASKQSQCNAECKLEYCGDGVVNASLGEQCDGESLPPYALTNGKCDKFCRLHTEASPMCGNGNVDDGEECDGEVASGWACTDCGLECVSPYRLSIFRWDAGERGGGEELMPYAPDDLESCVKSVLDACHSDGFTQSRIEWDGTVKAHFTAAEGTQEWKDNFFADDCVARYFLGHGISHGLWNLDWQALGWNPDGPPCRATAEGCSHEVEMAWEEKRREIYGSTSIYVNKQCEIVEQPAHTCGDFGMQYVVSPISLLLDPDVKITDVVSFNQFALNPQEKGRWFVWRASESTPLLVHDPRRTGRVDGAEQLFGNFTFGKTWKNGFEALASLDTNGDGTLRGSELSELSLWFDKNSDGVTDSGEVRPLSDVGVIALSTRFDRVDQKFGDLHADRGYERMVDGKIVPGRSVDWYAAGFANKMEAIAHLDKLAGERVPTKDEQEDPAPLAHDATAVNPTGSNVSGSWIWEVTGEKPVADKPKTMGVLVFKDDSGSLFGHSILEIPLEDNPRGIKSRMTMIPLDGERTRDPHGRTILRFTLTTPDGSRTTSEAILSPDEKTLEGKTVAEIVGTKSRAGKQGTYAYTWSAKRHAPSRVLTNERKAK
jgi:hypothetical protein